MLLLNVQVFELNYFDCVEGRLLHVEFDFAESTRSEQHVLGEAPQHAVAPAVLGKRVVRITPRVHP